MKRLVVDLTSCKGCPYLHWEENNSCSNDSGSSTCTKANRYIERNNKYPEFPSWCPLPEAG